MSFIDKILKELEPFRDRVLLSPLIPEEIAEIQANFDRKLPNYFIEFLSKIGLKQDLVWGINDEIKRFENLLGFLPSQDYFRFGDNCGEDYWLLKFDESDTTIYEYVYYNSREIESLHKTFEDLLLESLEKVKINYDNLVPNIRKDWCVQFSIDIGSGIFLVKELSKYLNVRLIKEPEYVETSEAGVKTFEGKIEIENKKIRLGKSDYEDWDTPYCHFY